MAVQSIWALALLTCWRLWWERAGELVSKNQLFDLVWPGLVVEENNLQVHISTLRKLLGSERIVTVAGRGYRFTGQVKAMEPVAPLTAVEPLAAITSARSVAVFAILRI